MSTEQDYTRMQRTYYNNETPTMSVMNHSQHNSNPDYWNILLSPLKSGDWSNKKVLDFGCGCGRNVINVLENFKVAEAHGCDISITNVNYCNSLLSEKGLKNFYFFESDGRSLNPSESGVYDLIMSTIVLQHIPVYNIRKEILTDMFRCLKQDGVLSIQMGFGTAHYNTSDYYDNATYATTTNSGHDVRVTSEDQLVKDLEGIGFKDVQTFVRNAWEDSHSQWIFAIARKP